MELTKQQLIDGLKYEEILKGKLKKEFKRIEELLINSENTIKKYHQELDSFAVSGSLPTEEQVLKTIFDCVFIRGIELEDYKRDFTNEQSGLYDALVELFKGNDR